MERHVLSVYLWCTRDYSDLPVWLNSYSTILSFHRFTIGPDEHLGPRALLRTHVVPGHEKIPQGEWVQPVPQRACRQLQCLHERGAHQLLLWCFSWTLGGSTGQVRSFLFVHFSCVIPSHVIALTMCKELTALRVVRGGLSVAEPAHGSDDILCRSRFIQSASHKK